MRGADRLIMRLRSLFRRARVEHELDAELRFHLDRQIEENLAAGMSVEQARASALRTLGNVTLVKEQWRDSLGLRLVDELRQDLRYAFRTLVNKPGFNLIAAGTVAVTEGTLSLLGVHPVIGRRFTANDDAPGSPETVMLAYGYWQRRFGGDASAIGRTTGVNRRSSTAR
jgi:hypothetical protein